MSGGALNYVYSLVSTAADDIRHRSRRPDHLAFADHLDLISKALHDVEWVLSSDYGDEGDLESLAAVLTPEQRLSSALELAKAAHTDLGEVIKRYALTR
jgi:hypothetical protein